MKKFLIFLIVLILLLICFWPEESFNVEPRITLTVRTVVDGNSVELNNGATVHLIGVTSTNEGKAKLEKLCGTPISLVADCEYPFNPQKINGKSVVYAYLINDDLNECMNSMLLKNGLADVHETPYLNDSLDLYRQYCNVAKKRGHFTPTPTPKPEIDYKKDRIVLPEYSFSAERKHSAWYTDGSMNLDMLEEVCDYNLPYMKSFANQLAGRAPGKFNFRQVCEIFNYCYKNWSYVNDPKNDEYVARASESIAASLCGDCDDFAVLMASCIIAVGGEAAITTAYYGDRGHAYAEVNIEGMDTDEIVGILKENYPHAPIDEIAVRKDQYGVWLNLDWQANYPGGPYWKSDRAYVYVKCGRDWEWVD